MLYFIPWVIFLLFVILAIPITLMLENRKFRSGKSGGSSSKFAEEPLDEEPDSQEFVGDDGVEMDNAAGEDFGAFADTTPAGGDDFSAFEDDFK